MLEAFLAEAATAGVKVIAYHYMKTSNFYAKAQPSWYLDQSVAQRLLIMWPRGPGMSACERAWQDIFIAQVVQLAQMGFEAFYFDEYPAEIGGDWSPACRARFRATARRCRPRTRS